MHERTVSLTCVAAVVLWTATFTLILAGTLVGLMAGGRGGTAISLALMAHGLALSAAAATMTIRNMLVSHTRLMEDAFAMGRDSTAIPMRKRQ